MEVSVFSLKGVKHLWVQRLFVELMTLFRLSIFFGLRIMFSKNIFFVEDNYIFGSG